MGLPEDGWVKFRESQKRGIYAIKVTDAGFGYLSKMAQQEDDQSKVEEKKVDQAVADAIIDDSLPAGFRKPAVDQARAIFDGPLLADYPHIQRLLADYDPQQQLAEAARLLEAAGEDDISIMVMERTSLTDLDKDVVRLAKAVFGEEVS